MTAAANQVVEGQRHRSRVFSLTVTLFSSLLGVVLLCLAVPRTLAAWASLEAQPAIIALQSGKRPADAELVHGIAGLQRAIGWTPSARRFTDLALLQLEKAERLPADAAGRHRLLVEAENNLLAGLAASPSNGFAWLRLALVREQLQAAPRTIVDAVLQSVDMAPNMRKLWLPRAALMLSYWRYFTPDEMPILRAQVRTIWSTHEAFRQQLLQTARQRGQTVLLRWAIGDDPALVEEFERLDRTLPPTRAR